MLNWSDSTRSVVWLQLLADACLCALALLVSVGTPDTRALTAISPMEAPGGISLAAFGFALGMVLLYSCVGIYRRSSVAVSFPALLMRGVAVVPIGVAFAWLLLKHLGGGEVASGAVPWLLLYVGAGAILVRSAVHCAQAAALGARRVLIVGSGPAAAAVASDIHNSRRMQRSVVGFYRPAEDAAGASATVIGPKGERHFEGKSLERVVADERIHEIIVAVADQRGGKVPMQNLLACRIAGTPVRDLAAFYELARGEIPLDSLKTSWFVYGNGFSQSVGRRLSKRVFDVVASSVLLVIMAPLMIATGLAVALTSPGPIIFCQQRVGLRGVPFTCFKFRSMRADAEADGVARWASKGDARVTALGSFIRKTRIDELPQLVNVLLGQMSLVGPRPERPEFVAKLEERVPFYRVRHCVKPGLTGWAQVRFTYGASYDDARRKHQFDLYYVKHNSLWLDTQVLLETVSVVLFREGAQ